MKKMDLLIIGVMCFAACHPKTEDEMPKSNERVVITPCIVHDIMLKDTTQIKTVYAKTDSGRISLSQYQWDFDLDVKFLSQKEFRDFRTAIWRVIRDPKSKVYVGRDMHQGIPQEIRDRVIFCDSMMESCYSPLGKEFIVKRFVCDSTSTMQNIDKIRFFEARYFNPVNGMMEIETLGYSLFSYIESKEARKELFFVFKNEEAMKQAKQFYNN
jgi:hypothetical protein